MTDLLVVDDNPVDIFIFEKILQREINPVDFKTMPSSKQALAFLEEHFSHYGCLPRIIVIDFVMPVMDGLELIRFIRSRFSACLDKTTIFLVTTNTMPDLKITASLLGVKQIIEKPITLELIGRILNR